MTNLNLTDVNYDDAKVPAYDLPDVLRFANGKEVKPETWHLRKAELVELFAEHVYGFTSYEKLELSVDLIEEDGCAFAGLATRKQVELTVGQRIMRVLLYQPNHVQSAPVFLGLNFKGNHSVHNDSSILKKENAETARGELANRWPVDQILKRGYALATLHYEDLMPDTPKGFISIFGKSMGARAVTDWGAIGVWSWMLARVLDYVEQDDAIDASRVAVMGHSRLGKAALWAAAQDERFALVIANNSGCGGAALSRRCFGERVDHINKRFPHWFAEAFKAYNHKEQKLPVDQHMLLALCAPRPLYISSAQEDLWADPKGEFLSAQEATRAYELLGKKGVTSQMPKVHSPSMKTVAYHIRAGKHDVTPYDWTQWLEFADMYL